MTSLARVGRTYFPLLTGRHLIKSLNISHIRSTQNLSQQTRRSRKKDHLSCNYYHRYTNSLMEITLRPYQVSDLGAFMDWACDDEVIRRSRIEHFSSREQALRYLIDVAIPHPWYRAICSGGRPIGFVCLDRPSNVKGSCRGMLAYALGRKYWGQGIMTGVVRMVVATLFKEFNGLERVEAIVDVDNKSSQRVLEKVGFSREGVLRKYMILNGKTTDIAMYCMLIDDLTGKFK